MVVFQLEIDRINHQIEGEGGCHEGAHHLHASRTAAVRGAMNAVSPQPVTNAEFTGALGHAVRRPTFLPLPRTALRIAFGEMSEILMAFQRVLPRVAERTGYTFKHAKLDSALAAVMAAPHRSAA